VTPKSVQRTTKTEASAENGMVTLMKQEGLLSSWFGRPSGIHVDSENGCFRGGMEPYRVGIALGY